MLKFEIHNGCTRKVFLIGKYAIKIPQINYGWRAFVNGLLCNLNEVCISKSRDGRVCPVLFHSLGGFLIVMPRVELISLRDFYNLDLKYFWPENDNTARYSYSLTIENKQSSFGYYDDKIVAIDYGD